MSVKKRSAGLRETTRVVAKGPDVGRWDVQNTCDRKKDGQTCRTKDHRSDKSHVPAGHLITDKAYEKK